MNNKRIARELMKIAREIKSGSKVYTVKDLTTNPRLMQKVIENNRFELSKYVKKGWQKPYVKNFVVNLKNLGFKNIKISKDTLMGMNHYFNAKCEISALDWINSKFNEIDVTEGVKEICEKYDVQLYCDYNSILDISEDNEYKQIRRESEALKFFIRKIKKNLRRWLQDRFENVEESLGSRLNDINRENVLKFFKNKKFDDNGNIIK